MNAFDERTEIAPRSSAKISRGVSVVTGVIALAESPIIFRLLASVFYEHVCFSGKSVIYRRIPVGDFKQSLPFMADIMIEGLRVQKFGYYGPGSEKLVASVVENARGKLTSLEEYLEANPLKL